MCWFHPECMSMTDTEFKVSHKSRNLSFICNTFKPRVEIVDKWKDKIFSDINPIETTVSKFISKNFIIEIIDQNSVIILVNRNENIVFAI